MAKVALTELQRDVLRLFFDLPDRGALCSRVVPLSWRAGPAKGPPETWTSSEVTLPRKLLALFDRAAARDSMKRSGAA